jgi:hypothetical protein
MARCLETTLKTTRKKPLMREKKAVNTRIVASKVASIREASTTRATHLAGSKVDPGHPVSVVVHQNSIVKPESKATKTND